MSRQLAPEDLVREIVPTDSLRTHPQNPNNGDLENLEESIRHHGIYRGIVISADDVILCGNHTWTKALELGRPRIAVDRLPFAHDDPQALKIMVEDNESARKVAQQIIWVKNALVFGGSDYQWRHEPCFYARKRGSRCDQDRTNTTVWEFPKEFQPSHPTQKPVETFAIPMRRHTSAGEICYDPFAGSGTAVVAAHQTGRIAYLMEIDPTYCDVILTRWADFTGKDPVREDGTKWSEVKA